MLVAIPGLHCFGDKGRLEAGGLAVSVQLLVGGGRAGRGCRVPAAGEPPRAGVALLQLLTLTIVVTLVMTPDTCGGLCFTDLSLSLCYDPVSTPVALVRTPRPGEAPKTCSSQEAKSAEAPGSPARTLAGTGARWRVTVAAFQGLRVACFCQHGV